ncbi:MAG: hypothetical protein L0Y72_25330 [Gemmataceae bacterium]|nr:hypothetical protein [Gemmataceae bacterium]MCI0742368.1 hypothetical protein [Gemmataceae bacterium]
MRRFKVTIAAVALVLTGLVYGQAGDDTAAILDKAHKALYPKGQDNTKKGSLSKNKGTIYVAGLELEFTQQIWVQYPGKFKEVMDMTVMNNAVKVTTVFDGKEGWIKANDMDIKVEKELLEEFQQVAYWMSLGQLKGLNDKGVKLSPIGEAQVNGKPAIGVKFSKEGKKDIDMYFDKATYLLVKTERRALDFMSGQETTEERIIQEYQDVGGQKMAKKVLMLRDGKKLLEAEVLESQLVERFDDGEFAKP